jgi:uridine kinase
VSTPDTSKAAEQAPDERSARLPFPPVVLGIAGCSGSGKTTLAAELARALDGVHFHLDTYYLDLTHLPLAERAQQNFDHPALVEIPLLTAHITALARGEAIERPLYDFATYTRLTGPNGAALTETVRTSALLLVEGIFALHFTALLPFYQLRIYLDTPHELCFELWLKRDVAERGRSSEAVRRQYETTVRPSSMAFVRPSAVNADLIIDGAGALDWKVEQIIAQMSHRGLLNFPD